MQTSGNIVVNGVTYTLGNTYEFNANVSGNASSDGSGATALSLDALKSNYSDYAAYYPKMRVMYYNAGAKYPYALYYPSGFWGGALHGWFPASIFKAQAFTLTSSCTARTETTATFKWSIGTDVTGIWYSTNGGSSYTYGGAVSGKSGTYTIKGLSANTKYTVKLRVKRKDNSVQVTGSSLSVTTYAYPYASSMPDFYIGDKVTIGIYNPLKRSVTIKMQTTGGTSIYNATATTTGTSITLAAASFDKSAMYKNIPNAQYAQYKITVTYGSNTTTKTGGYYRIKSGSLTPTIGTVSYKDTNSTTIAITGNNQKLIRNKSIPSFTVTGLAATTSATLSKCTVAVSGKTYTLTISGTTASGTGGVINNATNVKAVVTLTDSRGLTATKEVTLTMIDWYAPTATVTAKRQDGYYSETDLLVNANYAELDGKNSVTISYTATSTGGTKVSGTLTDGATGIATLDNGYAWMIVFTITDILGGTITYTKSIEKGVPIIFFDRNKYAVGVNCLPSDKALEVDGNVAVTGDYYLSDGTTVKNALATKLDKSTITVKSASKSDVTVATGTATNICSVTLAAGTWIVKGQLSFTANTSGYRIVSIGTSKQWSTDNTVLVGTAPVQGVRLSTTEIFMLTASTTYYLVAYQNSGSTLTCGGNLQAVRLK